jgi:hypothetical protein
MSQYGKHPVMSRNEARKRLPAGACKFCVYYVRAQMRGGGVCERCHVDRMTRTVVIERDKH